MEHSKVRVTSHAPRGLTGPHEPPRSRNSGLGWAARVVAMMGATVLLASCGSADPLAGELRAEGVDYITDAGGDPEVVGQVVSATTRIGLALIASDDGENIVSSPASLVIALGILTAGADGATEAEITELLGAAGQERDEAINTLVHTLDRFAGEIDGFDPAELPDSPFVHFASQVAILEGYEVNASYLEAVKRWYDVGVLETDLGGQEGKDDLDAWVNHNTAGLIEESAIEPDPLLRLVIQNAVLLAARWQEPLEPAGLLDFANVDGTSVPVIALGDRRELAYSEVDGWAMVRLPYGDDGTLVSSMVLPPAGVDPAEATPELLQELENALDSEDVVVAIPRLDLESTVDLIGILEDLGLEAIFNPNGSPLAHISTAEADLHVGQAVQQGRIRQDDEGTVAAAVTEFAVEATSAGPDGPEPKYFRADRPHLIIIEDTTLGWDLFQVAVRVLDEDTEW